MGLGALGAQWLRRLPVVPVWSLGHLWSQTEGVLHYMELLFCIQIPVTLKCPVQNLQMPPTEY